MQFRFINISVLFLMLLTTFTSCEPDPIDIELPPHEAKLVVSSQVIPGRGLVVNVSKSISMLNAPADSLAQDSVFLSSLLVDHAFVRVTAGGTTEVLQRVAPGTYASFNIPLADNEQYALYVKDSVSGQECSATAQLMPAVDFEAVQPVLKRTATDTTVYLHYTLSDPAESANFYLVNVVTARRKKSSELKDRFGLKKFEHQMFLLQDKDFNGTRYSAEQRLDVKAQDTIFVSLTNISQQYHHYLSVYLKSANVYNQLTGEPINFQTNVHNGYGFFNMTSPSVTSFMLSDY
ncbi:MAG: DUF4249 domain-containing protein [Hymenobacteraceae bacterium]|nr:DUF4249 domain-containing protein [Hymenobacteraceae bacterium]MDX5396390.1 DUF4249 domain-containing protein [Hymenobacteraceae bacterium]MDX5443360.1 DUF4249 domain-containing protein [Hymenobacteraceae bacterium]MDX5512452.1 DUF4249 domain-containing protein [Hymenobacteraceae bacterium]